MNVARVVVTIAAALVVAGVATGITYAATSTSGASVHACANTRGTLRLLDHGRCPRHYHKVTINERGPRGPRGRPGPPGQPGQPGQPGPGAVSFTVRSSTDPIGKESDPIGGTGLSVEVLCVPVQWAQVYINLDSPGSQFVVEGTAGFSAAGGAGGALWQSGNSVVNTPITALTAIEAVQDGTPHSVEFTTTGGTLVADLLVTQDGHTFSVHVSEYRDGSNNCWSDALVTPTG